jgi:hypothetical protein
MYEEMFAHFKIPQFEALNLTADTGGWKVVPPVLKPSDLSSLTGVHFIGLPREQRTPVNIEST